MNRAGEEWEKISTVAGGGGGGLSEVTSSDEGSGVAVWVIVDPSSARYLAGGDFPSNGVFVSIRVSS